MPYIIDLPSGAIIRSKNGFFLHVGVLAGYPEDFEEYIPPHLLCSLPFKLDPKCQYVVSKRNPNKGISSSASNHGVGGIVLEELSEAFEQGAEACPFAGERQTLGDTVKLAMQYLFDPEGLDAFNGLNANCQGFVIFVATKDRTTGTVYEQRNKFHGGFALGSVCGVLAAPLTGGASLYLSLACNGAAIINAITAKKPNNPY